MPSFARLNAAVLAAAGAFALSDTAAAQAAPAPVRPRLAFAPDPRKALTQHRHDSWTTDDGLPQASVTSALQSRSGYLWLGTEEGLARFDGLRFTVFNRHNTPGLLSHDIRALAEGADSALWIGTAQGLYRLQSGRVTPVAHDRLGDQAAFALLAESSGTVWVGTLGGGLGRLVGDSVTFFTPANGLPNPYITALARDHAGTLWIGTRNGLAVMRNGRIAPARLHALLDSAYIYGLHVDRTGQLWIGTNGRGLFRAHRSGVTRYTTREGLPLDAVVRIFDDSEGTVWIGTNGGGLSRLRDGRFDHFSESDGLTSDLVWAITQDREGNLWVGTKGGGLDRFRGARFTPLGRSEGLPHDVALAIYQDREGAMWIGTPGRGVSRLQNGLVTVIDRDDGLPSDIVLSIHEDRRGDHWIGTAAGLVRWNGGVRRAYTTRDGLPSNTVNAVMDDRAGVVWAGVRGGLVRLENGRLRTYRDGLTNDDVVALLDDGAGGLYVGTGGAGLFRFRNGAFTPLGTTSRELARATIEDLYLDSSGVLWIATLTGLFRYERERVTHYSRELGLFTDVIFAVVDDGRGWFWMCGNEGMSRVSRASLDSVAAGHATRVTSVSYGTSSGMRSRECNGGVQPAGLRDATGMIWFPTMSGPVAVDPSDLRVNTTPPPVHVEAVARDDRDVPLGDGAQLRLAAGVQRMTIHYAGLSLGAAEDVTYRIRLEGYDDDWIDAGTRREAHYTRLPPGRYTFRIMAANGDGVWSEHGAALPIVVRPFLYQRLSVQILFTLLLAAGAARWYQRRIAQHRAREQILLDRIAERSQAQAALAASERRYRDLFENALELVLTTDAHGVVTSVNRGAEDVLGATRDALVGRPLAELLAADEADGFERMRAGPRAGATIALRFRGAAGGTVPVETSMQEILDGGAITGYQLIGRNLAERSRLEEQLRQAHKMEAVGRLAGGVAHDFNNMLTVILATSDQMLTRLPPKDPLRDEAEETRRTALRAAQLTRQLLAFSRQQMLEPRLFDLAATVASLEGMLRRLISESIEMALSQGVDTLTVRADPGQVQQVVLNLAVNARDAMPHGGRLSIRTTSVELTTERTVGATTVPPGRYALLGVSDTGEGMDAATRARLFEPFFTTKGVGRGTGLGLATVYGIVQQSGGEILVNSEPGQGTTFEVFLPLAEGLGGDAGVTATDAARRSISGSETILLVEDEPAVRVVTRRTLLRFGYHVIDTLSPYDALEIAREHDAPIHLLLTDVVMPKLGGPELAERLRGLHPETRVLYVSGYTTDAVLRHSVERGEAGFLQKPFSPEELAAKLREVLDKLSPAPVRARR